MYIDTSALVAYYLPEKKSHIVQEMMTGKKSVQISQLTETELLSALKKKVRMKEIDKQQSDEAYHLFQNQRKQNSFQIFKVSDAVFKTCQMILKTTSSPLRTLDAFHLSVSSEYELELFSFDKLLVKTANELNIPTIEV